MRDRLPKDGRRRQPVGRIPNTCSSRKKRGMSSWLPPRWVILKRGFFRFGGPANNVHLIDLNSGPSAAFFDECVKLVPDPFDLGMVLWDTVRSVAVFPSEDFNNDGFITFFFA